MSCGQVGFHTPLPICAVRVAAPAEGVLRGVARSGVAGQAVDDAGNKLAGFFVGGGHTHHATVMPKATP
jgi:hypothetical protein